MRWAALALTAMLILSGCISGGSETDDPTPTEVGSANASATNATVNASDNATYLKNDDYEDVHVHDYWPGNSTERILMDETVSTNTMFSVFYTAFSPFFQDPKTGVGVSWFSLPNGSFVPVGTGQLVVEVDATGALERGEMQLAYEPADAADYTDMEPKGAQATWEIPVEPTMTDPPHSKSSRWGFVLDAEGHGAVLDGEINVKITAVKTRELETWPAHPDFWEQGQKSKLSLATIEDTYDESGTFATRFLQGEQQEDAIRLPEGTIVPPETQVLLVEFWFARSDDAKNHANGGVHLLVKEGSSASYYDWMGEDRVQERDNYKMYAVPVDGTNWDSPYAEQSNWAFRVYAPVGVHEPGEASIGIAEAGSGNYTLDLTAYRVIPPWLQSLMSGESQDDRAGRRG